jgi:hypothetical protein
MAKTQRFSYFKISGFSHMSELTFTDITEYTRLLANLEIKLIFTQQAEEFTNLFFKSDGTMYALRNQPYRFIEDYEESIANGFSDAKDFYEAQQLGFTTFKEFDACRAAGLTDKSIFEKARKGGFIEGMEQFNEKVNQGKAHIYFEYALTLEKISNAVELCNFASGIGFVSYRDFEKAILHGFRTQSEYTEGVRLNFDNGNSYRTAIKLGFENHSEYQEAAINFINSKKEFTIYKKLKERARNQNSMDELITFDYLAAQPNGRKISVAKIEEHLDSELVHYYFTETQKENKKLPDWFTRKLHTRDSIKTFLYSNPKLRQLGIYDAEGEYFEIFKIRESKVFVDASNVAHANQKGERPQMRRIWQVVNALKQQRFPNIVVIADASLKHKVSDEQNKKKLDLICTYLEAPAGSTADEFIIDKARKETGYIVTNDTFRDWKEKDKWVSEHIDKIRIPFMIQKEIVTFPLIERFGEIDSEI